MRKLRKYLIYVVCFVGILASEHGVFGDDLDTSKLPPAATVTVDFVRDIQPLFASKCVACHGAEKQKGDFRLDQKTAALRGGDSYAPDIVPGKSAESPLIHFVAQLVPDMNMPPKGDPLTSAQIGLLRAWIDQGAKWPEEPATAALKSWALEPIVKPAIPNETHYSNPIDAFLLAKLAEKNLAFAPPADARTLLRRLYYSVIGLPPTAEAVAAFESAYADQPENSVRNVVEQLLASPHFGERWARHWLDVVRFAESNGFETNGVRKNAWPYRDWVIRAMNADLPYDRFILEQLAGDAFGAEEATGFIVGGATDIVKSPDPVLTANQRADDLNDFAATTASAFLGLTLHCARCHNHKFDPIAMTDYYSVVACFAGVQHGERAVKPANFAELQAAADILREQLQPIESQLARFDPLAFLGDMHFVFTDQPTFATALLPSKGDAAKYPEGIERGQAGFAGDPHHLPTLGKGYLYWNNVPKTDVFVWSPQLTGRYRVWLSWGAGYKAHAEDAHYLLDHDGDLKTTADQTEIAKVSHQQLAYGSGKLPEQRQWSGFYNAGAHNLTPTSRIVLRGGETDQYVSADVVLFQADREPSGTQPRLRLPVTRGKNVERFLPVAAKYLRFTIAETTQLEPCIDELEVFSADQQPKNVALTTAGAKASSSGDYADNPYHKLEHLNDGRYGNEQSWISNERGRGWVQLEFANTETIDRVAWSRDRDNVPRYNDRLATRYLIEVSRDGQAWQTVASSNDRLPFNTKVPGGVIYASESASSDMGASLADLLAARKRLEAEIAAKTNFPTVYAGRFVAPADTFRMHRGDPMQPREKIASGGLNAFPVKLSLPLDTPEQARRLALAKWIASPENPLTARVMVNRLWHYHFGVGLVDTPSDFGQNGGRPSHPELLDYLAGELMANGWRLKHIHRLILNSAAFRQGSYTESEQAAKGNAVDAGNRLLWHFRSRRLDAESLRDSILAVSGKLDRTMGGPGFDLFMPNSNYVKVYQSKTEFEAADFRRMVYQSKPRTELDNTFGSFDCPDAGQVAPNRTNSTTPLQALNLLNSPFAIQQSQFFAERLEQASPGDVAAQVRRTFQLAFAREPSTEELAAGEKLVQTHGLAALCRALLNANEFLLVF